MGEEARRMKPAFAASVLAALCIAAWAVPVRANDRPFLLTSSAAAEEDDDRVWAIETWWQRIGTQRMLAVAPEYAFDPVNSIQLEVTRGNGNSQGTELELKHLFNHIARDGWGWGIDVSLSSTREEDVGSRRGVAVKLPWSIALHDGDAMLHVNAGLQKQQGERREWVASMAFEHKLPWRTSLFVELAREDRQTLRHLGARHWIQRDKLAVDVSLQQLRAGADKASGLVIGLAWYDL
jgi:hypothetical protein